jgi:hypothetical protein
MQNANDFFENSVGSENLYRYSFTHFVYTDGVKTMAQDCHAYWLIDLIISHQVNDAVKKESFQVWDLKRVNGNEFTIIATDGNHNKVTSQEIPFSDFPYDLATIWLVDRCLMLPNEY